MRISPQVDASTYLYMKKSHKSHRDPTLLGGSILVSRRVDPGWLLLSYKYLLQMTVEGLTLRGGLKPTRARSSGHRANKNGTNLVDVALNICVLSTYRGD